MPSPTLPALRALALSLLLPAVAVAPLAAQGAGTPPSPTFEAETSVTLVEIPVDVERGGDPVLGLGAEDFVVRQDGRVLPVVAVERIDLGALALAAERDGLAPMPPTAVRRHVLFLFDATFSRPHELSRGIESARQLVENDLQPSDQVGIVTYTDGDVRSLLSFTGDHREASDALVVLDALVAGKDAGLELVDGEEAAPSDDPLALQGRSSKAVLLDFLRGREAGRSDLADALASLPPPVPPAARTGTRAPDLLHNAINNSRVVQEPNIEATRRSKVRRMAAGLELLAETLREVEGRKLLMYVGRSLPTDHARNLNGMRPSNLSTDLGSDLIADLRDVVDSLQRDGWVLHAFDLTGTRGGLMGSENLAFLTSETGGKLVKATNDLAAGMDRALQESETTYLVTVQVDGIAFDGSYHPLEVELRDPPNRTRLRHRQGFYAPVEFVRKTPAQRLAEAQDLVTGGEERDELGVRTAMVPLARRAGGGQTLGVVLEVPGEKLRGLEVYGYAFAPDGRHTDHFAYAVDLDGAVDVSRLAGGGVRVLGTLDLPPDRYRLRLLARDSRDGRTSLLDLPVDIRADAGRPSLEALFLAEPDEPWLSTPPRPGTLRVQGSDVRPSLATRFDGATAKPVLVVGRGLSGPDRAFRTQILDGQGRPVAPEALQVQAMAAGEDGAPDVLVASLDPSGLVPGDYLLLLRLESDGQVATASRPFHVATARVGS